MLLNIALLLTNFEETTKFRAIVYLWLFSIQTRCISFKAHKNMNIISLAFSRYNIYILRNMWWRHKQVQSRRTFRISSIPRASCRIPIILGRGRFHRCRVAWLFTDIHYTTRFVDSRNRLLIYYSLHVTWLSLSHFVCYVEFALFFSSSTSILVYYTTKSKLKSSVIKFNILMQINSFREYRILSLQLQWS